MNPNDDGGWRLDEWRINVAVLAGVVLLIFAMVWLGGVVASWG